MGPAERRPQASTSRSGASYDEAYGVGVKLLRQSGWKEGEGLGREGQVRRIHTRLLRSLHHLWPSPLALNRR